ncbi:hypothetical protein QVD17_38128 [Tagetes erecta]|uniref:CCHC-type domain-containing protein n=1 Tax=Tagetes erecta TaxID=13708 RepID=A0AAD8JVZ1_TARER|nr:hypothetical protein QVD17_38128 [Tagetes erecta]
MVNDEQEDTSLVIHEEDDNFYSVPIEQQTNLEDGDVNVNLEDEDLNGNDPFLNLLCYDDDEVEDDDKSVEDWSESEIDLDKDVEEDDDDDNKDEEDVYPCYDPSIDWKLARPIVTMKFQSPAQLKDMLINYGVANGYQLVFTVNDNDRLLVRCGTEETSVDETRKKIKFFEEKMTELKTICKGAYDHLMERDPTTWSRAFFEVGRACDAYENGMSESFNSSIRSARRKPIISMFDEIRRFVMCRMFSMAKKSKSLKDQVCPRIKDKLEDIKKLQRHIVAALVFIKKDPKAYVSDWFKKDMFKEAYKHAIAPLKGSVHWPKTDDIIPLPPKERRMPGRPTVKRKRDPSEKEKKNKKVGIGRKIRCHNCLENGHNIRSCTKEKKDPQPKEARKKGRKRRLTQEKSS